MGLGALADALDGLVAALEGGVPTSAQVRDFAATFAGPAASLEEDLIPRVERLISEAGGGDRRITLTDAAAMIRALLSEVPDRERRAERLESLRRHRAAVMSLYEHAVEARRCAVQDILDRVTGIANDLYETVHPNEGLGASRLHVRRSVERSVTLHTMFHGEEEPPLLHYSESHLDTLGLCYFLAVRRHEANKNPHFKLIVLDDVLHSVDAAHRGRFADLLREEFSDHQIVITTHDQHFYDRLRSCFGNDRHRYAAVVNWDLERGPILGDPSTDLDRLLAPARDRAGADELSAACGRFFESHLKIVAERLNVPVVARFTGKHTIGDLWPPVARKLRKHPGFAAVHTELVDRIDSCSWVRNACGAHSNETASGVTPQEVREFAAGLDALYHATHCSRCGRYVAQQDDEDWRCRCGGLVYERRAAPATMRVVGRA